jgi:dTDP-4-amino-4,6-dideoxygalactose transaminase
MNDLSATIGLHNFPHFHRLLERHRENADFLRSNLNYVSQMDLVKQEIFHHLQLRLVGGESRNKNFHSADWVFTIRVERRADFMKKMQEAGIGVSRVHDRNDKHECLSEFRTPLPNTDQICGDMCCIPCGWWVTDDDRQYIVDIIRKGW